MKKKYISMMLLLFIVPTVALASWWNPFSWFNNWSFSKNNNSETQALENRIKELEAKNNLVTIKEETKKPEEQNTPPSLPAIKKDDLHKIEKQESVVQNENIETAVKAETVNSAKNEFDLFYNKMKGIMGDFTSSKYLKESAALLGEGKYSITIPVLDDAITSYNNDIEKISSLQIPDVTFKSTLEEWKKSQINIKTKQKQVAQSYKVLADLNIKYPNSAFQEKDDILDKTESLNSEVHTESKKTVEQYFEALEKAEGIFLTKYQP